MEEVIPEQADNPFQRSLDELKVVRANAETAGLSGEVHAKVTKIVTPRAQGRGGSLFQSKLKALDEQHGQARLALYADSSEYWTLVHELEDLLLAVADVHNGGVDEQLRAGQKEIEDNAQAQGTEETKTEDPVAVDTAAGDPVAVTEDPVAVAEEDQWVDDWKWWVVVACDGGLKLMRGAISAFGWVPMVHCSTAEGVEDVSFPTTVGATHGEVTGTCEVKESGEWLAVVLTHCFTVLYFIGMAGVLLEQQNKSTAPQLVALLLTMLIFVALYTFANFRGARLVRLHQVVTTIVPLFFVLMMSWGRLKVALEGVAREPYCREATYFIFGLLLLLAGGVSYAS